MSERDPILVTGATGKVGRQVVSGLPATGTFVRALTRDPVSADLPDGVEVVRGDLSVPDSLPAALDGVETVFLAWPTLMADHAAATTIDTIAKHARRIVYLSARGVPDDPDRQVEGILGSHAYLERLIERSGMQWTFLRPGGFAANALGWAPQIRSEGIVRWVHRGAARPPIHERDIAAVAVRVLTEGGHDGATYVLTGPETLTQAQQVQAIGEAIGRPLRFEEVPPGAVREQMLTTMPETIVDGILDGQARLVTEPESVTHMVEEITGTPARTFHEWAVDHADDFRAATTPAEEGPMTTEAIAREYVSLCRQGRFFDPAMDRLFSANIARVAPMETGGVAVEVRGSEAIAENSRRQNQNEEIHGAEIDGPFVGTDGRFAVRFAIEMASTLTGERRTVTKISLYTVEGGKIVREEVYYHTPPHPDG